MVFGRKQSISDTVMQFLKEDDWSFKEVELGGRRTFVMGFGGSTGEWMCVASPRDKKDRFVFHSQLQTKVPESKRKAVAEYLTRANYGLILGNFEMDFSDGEVRYKTAIDVEDGQLSQRMVKIMVYTNVKMMDRYLPGLMRVIDGEASPADAIGEVEQ